MILLGHYFFASIAKLSGFDFMQTEPKLLYTVEFKQ